MIKQNLEPINIMLADNNPLILSGMSDIFDRDPRFSLVATSATAEGFLGMVMRVPVEIGVIDWQLPVLGGAKLIEVLRDQENAPRLVIYGDDTPDLPRLAMTAGAAGFAPRSGDIEVLLSTCIQVAAGKMVFPFLSNILSIKNKSLGLSELANIPYALTISAGEKLDDPSANDKSGANLDLVNPNLDK